MVALAVALLLRVAHAAECGTPAELQEVTDAGGWFPAAGRTNFKGHQADLPSGMQMVSTNHFDLHYGSTFKVANNHYAKQQYVLVQCGTGRPGPATVDALTALPADYTRKYFTIPLQSWSSDSTASLAYLDVLGVHDRLKYVAAHATAPCLQKALNCDESVKAIDSWTDATVRKQQQDDSDAYFVDTADDHENTVAFTVAHDPSALNQAEWIKFIGAFFNKEDVAQQHMEAVTAKWNTLKAEGAAGANAGKLVVFIEHDTWGRPDLTIDLSPYKVELVTAAGGTSLTEAALKAASPHATSAGLQASGSLKVKYNASEPAAVTAFKAAIADAEMFVDESIAWPDPRVRDAAAIEASFGALGKPVYREDGMLSETFGVDWLESRFARPDVALQDFVAALHGTGAARTYLSLASETEVIKTKDDCATHMPACGGAAFAPIDTLYERYAGVSLESSSGPWTAMLALVLLLK